MQTRRGLMAGAGLFAAAVATAVVWSIRAGHPWPHTPLSQFLALFGWANTAAWPTQIMWYLAAVAMVGLALWPVRRSAQLICVLAAAYFAWIGNAYFAWLMPGMRLSLLWAAVFTLQAVLVVVAGVVRSDLVIRPAWTWHQGWGRPSSRTRLSAIRSSRLAGGHALRTLPVLGVSP